MEIEVIGGEMSETEKQAYISHVKSKATGAIKKLIIKIDGDFVDLEWHYVPQPFDRIRRITGYLVGTLDRFNDGKLAEVKDRVHHSYNEDYYLHEFSGLIDD